MPPRPPRRRKPRRNGFTPRPRFREVGFTPRPRSREAGFTLVELMVVIVIIGLLATVVMINVLPSQDRAMTTKARADIATLSQAMEMYRLDNMRYPPSLAALAQPRPTGGGAYVRSLPDDPWGRPYQMNTPGQNGSPFDIVSLGADGTPGGQNENADIRGSEQP